MRSIRLLSFAIIAFVLSTPVFAQPKPEKHTAAGYTYISVPGDPLNARIYTLNNGLTIYLSVNKSEPRVQTMIAVRAGSKNDPSDATGLAHYLEHLLFKGTDKYGSLDYTKEKPYLDEIENLYEVYRGTRDTNQRKAIYHQIDSVSGVAAKWAIANEYDKLVAELGAKGTNAFTSDEQTVYINDIPSNQIEKWLTIEGERFRHPVLRLFHTELEAVYEEKNRHLDDDESEAWEALFAELFPKHPYGQQTTIGTVEHLKNPSIKKIKEFYSNWYVPNNMAVVIAGDIDPDQVIKMVDQKMGGWVSKPTPNWQSPVEEPITKPASIEVYGPDAESFWLAYRLPGVNSHEAVVAEMLDFVLSNSSAGLIDLNLNQQQKVLRAATYLQRNNDYSAHVFYGNPKEGQSLDEVRDLLLSQIELVKKGEFDAELLPAIINDLTLKNLRLYEQNWGRADEMMGAFIHHTDWPSAVSHVDELAKVTKQEIVDFANKYYGNNYVTVYKRTGDRRNVVKVTKPPITPVEVNRTAQSDFLKQVSAMPALSVTPHFLDYKHDITETKLKGDVPVYYLHNDENDRFTLYYVVDMGKRHDKRLRYALDYLDFLGTDKMSAADVKRKFFALGSNFSVSANQDESYVSLSGLQKNFKASVALFENFLANARADEPALQEFIGRTIKTREDAKKDKNEILWSALRNYTIYGKINPQTYDLTNAELQKLNSAELIKRIHDLTMYPHRVLYYGPTTSENLVAILNVLHHSPQQWRPIPAPVKFVEEENAQNTVYFVNYDMAQAEVLMFSKGLSAYDPAREPVIRMFNEYYGGSMASITFQTIRESKALAYAVWSRYMEPNKREDPYNIFAYVGSQADKSPETMKSMFELLTDMPRADKLFEESRTALENDLASERTTRENILWSYENARKLGLDHDIRKDIYEAAPKITFEQIEAFQKQNIRGHKYAIAVLGSKDKVDMKDLSKYGNVQELSLEDIFGY